MAKKRRNKKYTGKDAKLDTPIVKRYNVDDTSKSQRWWQDHKPELVLRGIQAGAVTLIGLGLWGIISLIF